MGEGRETGSSFARRLRRMRDAAGLSQEELALRAGMTAKGVGAIERGVRRYPYPHTVRALADALGLSGEERDGFVAAAPRRTGAFVQPSADGTLPPPPTPFVGREREVASVRAMLTRGVARLLTITGPGGVGKTRLALEVAGRMKDACADGVAFVSLASQDDPARVPLAIFRALGLTEVAGRSESETLREYLARREILLVLDNFERLVEAAPEVSGLLGAAPNLRVLATSRIPLRIRGEQEYPLQPLPVPDNKHRGTDLVSVKASPAARLFAARAAEANPSFELTIGNAASVSAICRRLDGLPLALELVAARSRFLGPAEVLSHLHELLEVGGARDLPNRQKTLSATMDWSYDLLSEEERECFRTLSVFAARFGLEASRAVAGSPPDHGDIARVLGSLVEQSLVVAEISEEEGTRYRMLEPLRQYALARLGETGAESTARERHAEYYADLARRAEPELRGELAPEWMGRLQNEGEEIHSAVTWAIGCGRADLATRIAFALARFFWTRGPYDEVLGWMDEVFGVATENPLDEATLARAAYVAGVMEFRLGGSERLRKAAEEARKIEDDGDARGAADMLMMSGLAEARGGDPSRARTLLERSRNLFEISDDAHGRAMSTVHLGALSLGGDPGRLADEYLRRGEELAGRSGDPMSLYTAHYHLALADQARGRYTEASEHYMAFLHYSDLLGDRTNIGYALLGLAECQAGGGDPECSARLLGAAEANLENLGIPFHFYNVDPAFHQHHLDIARKELDPVQFDRMRAVGRTMTTEEAIREAGA